MPPPLAIAETQSSRSVPHRLKPRQIEAFRAVMQLGNMTAAARQLGISQPAVSRLLADLQESLGYSLFIRRRHGMVATADAQRLHAEVESVFIGLDELSRRALAIRDLEVGEVRICAVSLYGNGLLPQIIAEFVRRHAGINITLEICPHDKVVDWLISRRCDIGLTTGGDETPELEKYVVAESPAVCVMPVDHPLVGKSSIQAADLAGLSFISFPKDAIFRYRTDNVFDRLDIERDMRVTAGTHEAVCNLVSSGLGLSIISPFSPHLRNNPRLAFRPFKPSIDLEIGVLCDSDRLSLAARHFREFTINWFRDNRVSIL
ncbi:LysR family transcriptional regulator [Bosea minatitlanensis]|uniref:LysR family transcriptional regulator n=1 Tax=Bosea minatitlanensis TaxID=128782 RepID=A0ABW0F2H5_9HYPH|nr:LysR family transcriptional regulator [Bosea minatitlanensis]MCT4493397.1 LysR family transcriptional regulator [Bosea minatitlanensis]